MAQLLKEIQQAIRISQMLESFGMRERDGILEQLFPNGNTMQVRPGEDNATVYSRTVTPGVGEPPEWINSMGFLLAEWIKADSPVWQWLKSKGIDEVQVQKRLLGLK